MNTTRVIVANELRSYREAIARVFEDPHPHVEVLAVGPEDLDREVVRLRPDLVVCSGTTPEVEARVPVWVELYPGCEACSRVCVRGEVQTVENIQLADLLALLDRTQDLAALG